MKPFRVVSLFSGAGGLDLGFKMSGMYQIIFANDVNLYATTTYAKNFEMKLLKCGGLTEAEPNVVLSCDVEKVLFSPLAGEADVVVGPPCQDFSIVRGPARVGITIKRGRLYAHFIRALAVLQPKAFVFENVPGLTSANGGLAYKTIIEDFARLNTRWEEVKEIMTQEKIGAGVKGYEIVFSDIVDFAAAGVPQKRERLIIIGIRRDLIRSAEQIWHARAVIDRALRKTVFAKFPLTPLEVFEGRRLDELQEEYREIMEKWRGVWEEVGTETALMWKQKVWDDLTFDAVQDYLRLNGVQRTDSEELDAAFREHEVVLKLLGYYNTPVSLLKLPDGTTDPPDDSTEVVERMKRIPPGENHEFVKGTKWEVKGRGISLIYRRLHPLIPAYTVVAYGGGGTHGYHYDRDRATLTLRERARLQTFPDLFLFYGSKTQIRAQIGEAVPPLAAMKIAETLARILADFYS